VLISRSILNKLGVKTGYNDELLCFPPERMASHVQYPFQVKNASFEIYPNPSFGMFCIKTSDFDFDQSKILITDLSGREIDFRYWLIDKKSVELDLLNASPGIYLIKVIENITGTSVGYSRLILIRQ
jgi:hypothetical protein